MAYSGTTGLTRVNVGQLIADAAMLCERDPSLLTANHVVTAKRQLFYFLTGTANLGRNLWCVTKTIFGTLQGKRVYDLPVGTVDVDNSQLRQFQRPTGDYASSAGGTAEYAFDQDLDTACIQTSADGNISVNYGVQTAITVLGIMSYGTKTYDLIFESSDDGVTYNSVYQPGAQEYEDRQWVCFEVVNPRSGLYFRVREAGGATLTLREAVFGYQIYDVDMLRVNQDAYNSLPSKDSTGTQPPQWWYNRVLTQPQMYMWPPLSTNFYQIIVWRTRQVMDVGDLTNQLEIPDRWLDTTVHNLALRMSMGVFTGVLAVPSSKKVELKEMAAVTLQIATAEERDVSPIDLGFNISAYTRSGGGYGGGYSG